MPPPFVLSSLLSRQPQETIIQTPDYSGIFGNKWLRKQKRSELRDFLLSDAVYAIVEGPPGSLKTACVQHVAAELNYTVKELDVVGKYEDERSQREALRLFSNDMAGIVKGGDGRKFVTLVSNVNLVKNPAKWVLPERSGGAAKVIFELHDTPKELTSLVKQGVVRKITFKALMPKDLEKVAAAIGFRNPSRAALQCGDAHMLYTASQIRDNDAWKNRQLKPFSEAEEILRGQNQGTYIDNDRTPLFLQQHCGQAMSLEATAAFLEDMALADTMATSCWRGGDVSEIDHHYSLDACPHVAASARHYADSLPSRIDWSGKLQAIALPGPYERSIKARALWIPLGSKPQSCKLSECAGQTRCLLIALQNFSRLATPPASSDRRAPYSGCRVGEASNPGPKINSGAPKAKRSRVETAPLPLEDSGLASHFGMDAPSAAAGSEAVATIGEDALATGNALDSFKYEERVLVASDASKAT